MSVRRFPQNRKALRELRIDNSAQDYSFTGANRRKRKMKLDDSPKSEFMLATIAKYRSITLLTVIERDAGYDAFMAENTEDETEKRELQNLAYITINDDFVQKFTKTKVKIQKIDFTDVQVDLSFESFIHFCKMFDEVSFKFSSGSESLKLFCDQTITQIVSSTIFKLEVESSKEGLDISDITLQAIAAGKSNSWLNLGAAESKFTTAGIREFIENIINENWKEKWHLGVLTNQHEEALEFDNYTREHPELPYQYRMRDWNGLHCWFEDKATGKNILIFEA